MIRNNVIGAIEDAIEVMQGPTPNTNAIVQRLRRAQEAIVKYWPIRGNPKWENLFYTNGYGSTIDAGHVRRIQTIQVVIYNEQIQLHFQSRRSKSSWRLCLPVTVWQEIIANIEGAINEKARRDEAAYNQRIIDRARRNQ